METPSATQLTQTILCADAYTVQSDVRVKGTQCASCQLIRVMLCADTCTVRSEGGLEKREGAPAAADLIYGVRRCVHTEK